ncbi:hypothetical protein SAMN05216174_11833 [Actinokineospora iranica]|uniref:Uncharacterized protein n=1 Tax=Actinokineospora iranica TaxID=1271860 RepID=A0A1G6XMP8_9PSEU|nr:hypothetical protein SAMN05216174_11833 [Actinokineospora iranica]
MLRQLVDDLEHAVVMPLGHHLSLLPMTTALRAAVARVGAPPEAGFADLPAGFDRALAACSVHGPVAYLEAEYFGGVGAQSAQVWDGGNVVLGPLYLAEGEPFPAEGTPISRALRRLGVTSGGHRDEFDAVGLHRHRDTLGWLLG